MLHCDGSAGATGPRCDCRPTRRGLLGVLAAGAALAAGGAAGRPAWAQPAVGRVDVHHHVTPPAYLAAVQASPLPRNPVADRWTLPATLEAMERGGVATAVLSLANPGLAVAGDKAEDLGRACNEFVAGLVRDNPGRFGAFAALPMPDVDATLRVLAHAYDQLAVDGVFMLTSYGGRWLGDPLFAPVFEELNRREAVVYTHPISAPCCENLQPEIGDSTIEWGTDTTRTIASLTFAGAATRWPRLRFIFSHAGGTMPFLIERFETLARNPAMAAKLPGGVRAALAHWNYDTAQAANSGSLGALLGIVPASQVLFGSDYPFRQPVEQASNLRGAGLSPAVLREVEVENARRLLPRLRA